MKALLNQFIGGGQTKGDIMPAGSGSQKMEGDSAGAGTSSFMGLMMGFLGLNEKPVPAANAEAAAPSKFNKGDKKLSNGNSLLEIPNEITGKSNPKAAALKSAEVDGKEVDGKLEGKNETSSLSEAGNLNTPSGEKKPNSVQTTFTSGKSASKGEEKNKGNLLSTVDKLKARGGNQVAESGSAAASTIAVITKGEGTGINNSASEAAEKSVKVRGEAKQANTNGAIKSTPASADKITQQLKLNGEAADKTIFKAGKNGEALKADKIKGEKSNSGKRLDLSNNSAAKGRNIKPVAGKEGIKIIPAPVAGDTFASGKEQVVSKRAVASQVEAENIMTQASRDKNQVVKEGKKNPAAAAVVIKKVQQKQAKKLKMKAERGRAPEATARRAAVQGSQSTPASVQNSELLLRKPAANFNNLAPGKMISQDAAGKIGAEADADSSLPREAGQASEKGFKEIHLNEFKSTRLAEAAGRKKFSRHLGEVGRQQSGKSRETARQTTQWKHHRFVMKDGNTINIASRSADGALQLQLNAGNGELSKVLHQHLQEIRQHVQQELDIKIDLQLQDFSGQQSNRENEAGSSSSTPTRRSSNPGESSEVAASTTITSSGTEGMRYFGFNNNEWTA